MYSEYDYGDNYDNDEHISGLIVIPKEKQARPPIYRSKYRELVREELTRNKSDHKTFGVKTLSLNTPDQFLRKNSGIHPKRPEIKHEHYRRPNYQHKLPAWDPIQKSKLSDKPNSSKNFKKENILNIKKFTRLQNNNLLQSSGSLKTLKNHQYHFVKSSGNKNIRSRYLQRPSARNGTDSKNVKKNIPELDKSNAKILSAGESTLKPSKSKSMKNLSELPKGRYITDEERTELLSGMKKKWDELMKQFQALPFLTDTPPKAKRKSIMEENLKQLEKDIDEIERHPHIYVYDE